MEIAALITELRDNGDLLAEAAEKTTLTTPVPSCPEWQMRDLLLHVGGVHRWATAIVRDGRSEPPSSAQPNGIAEKLSQDGLLVDWFRQGHAELLDTLVAAPADLDCWAFLPTPSPLVFWARRQAHETTVHRVDAQAAVGEPGAVGSELAADGIDELLTGLVANHNQELRSESERTLRVAATDIDARWLVRIGPDKPTAVAVDGEPPADTVLSGPAADLYLALWNRRSWDGMDVAGDAALLRLWAENVRV